jgi:hypothetical protein
MHRNPAAAALLSDEVSDIDRVGHPTSGVEHIDQSSPAISQARRPAFTESKIIARSRSGNDEERETWRSMRRSMGGVITLACLPGIDGVS